MVTNKPIYVKLPDGKFRLAKEILLEEIEALEEVVKENQDIATANPPVAYAADLATDAASNKTATADKTPTDISQNLAAAKSKNLVA